MNEKKIILAIDDAAENLTLIRTMLENDFDIRLAKSGQLALRLLQITQVDLILLDIEMPEMSGFDFMKRFRLLSSLNKDTPVIMVTSHATPDFVKKSINEGAKDYIVKPINDKVLYKKIDSIIGMPDEKKPA